MNPKLRIKWSETQKRIASLSEKEKLNLFKDLYELSSENKEFLSTKLQTDEEIAANINLYLDRILEPFEINSRLTKEGLKAAKKTIRDFQKACDDQEAVVELMFMFVEEGTRFASDIGGNLFEDYYLILEEVLADLVSILKSPSGKVLYNDHRRNRFRELAEMGSGIGWGYGDFVGDRVAELE